MTEYLNLLVESGGTPSRTDAIAYNLGMPVSPLNEDSPYKAIFNTFSKKIQYHPKLLTSEIRSLIGLGILLNFTPPVDKEIIIANENIYDTNFRFRNIMKDVEKMLIKKEDIETAVHDMKIYKIEELAQMFDVSEEMMYRRMKSLHML